MPADDGSEILNVSINQGLFPGANGQLLQANYGTKITDAETQQRKDTGVQQAVEEIANLLSTGKLIFDQPLTIRTRVNGEPAVRIIYESGLPGVDGQPGREGDPGAPGAPGEIGPVGPSAAIEVTNAATGEMAQFGIGLQNIGIVANEFVPLPFFFVNPETAHLQFTNTGGGTGPTGETGYNPPGRANEGAIGGRSGTNYGELVGQGTGWQPLYQQGVPGVPPSSPNSGATFPFTTGPLGWGFWFNNFGGGNNGGSTEPPISGHSGTVTVVTDVSWDEATCEMTKTTKTLTIENGLITGVAD